jgi:toxin ParE1/3/4
MAKPKSGLTWSPDADDDLISIWRYGADEWSPAMADDHLFEIWSASDRLRESPELGRSRDELILGLRSIPIDPHIVFYRISTTAIEIIRVLHQREDIENVFH